MICKNDRWFVFLKRQKDIVHYLEFFFINIYYIIVIDVLFIEQKIIFNF